MNQKKIIALVLLSGGLFLLYLWMKSGSAVIPGLTVLSGKPVYGLPPAQAPGLSLPSNVSGTNLGPDLLAAQAIMEATGGVPGVAPPSIVTGGAGLDTDPLDFTSTG